MEKIQRKLIFENGQVFYGTGFGATCDTVCEVVFNTSMVGYQEILTDPSYCAQLVVMTYPLIGNYGLTDEDDETRTPRLGGLIVREYNDLPSNFRYTKTLGDVMAENNIPGIQGVDTRQITRMIRREGSMRALLTDAATDTQQGLSQLANTPVVRDQVARVSCKKLWYSRTTNYRYNVVMVDCGVKHNIIRKLNSKGCNVTVVPYNTSAQAVLALRPDGVMVSNGPGDPQDVQPVIDLIRDLQGRVPVFGICLGHQLIALANGGDTFKMKFGHRGGNHPVKNLLNGKIEITSQNHSYAVDLDSIKNTPLSATHINLLDETAEGMACDSQRIFSVQYHPESAPGPQDSDYLFDRFIDNMMDYQQQGRDTNA